MKSPPANVLYWQSTHGAAYREMIRTREGHSTHGYEQQEQFLTAFVMREQERLGRPVDILEFGCGFGRHAQYLAGLPGVRYHGYDFSEAMTAPLREHPPRGMEDLAQRLLVGPDVREIVGSARFDLVFTVSVMIHNAPEKLPDLFQTFTSLLRPEGAICLVENQLVPFSVYENDWHDGCWLHAYPDLAHAGWDVFVAQDKVDTHDLYVFRRNGSDARRLYRFNDLPEGRSAIPVSEGELAQMALRKIRIWAGQVSHALRHDRTLGEAKLAELNERIETERTMFRRRAALGSISDELARLRNQERKVQTVQPAEEPSQAREPLLFNAAPDTRWAAVDSRFNRVLHVFHQEWHGIRAAAAYLPGQKLAISATDRLDPIQLRRAVELCSEGLTRTIVFHSLSPNTLELISLLRKALGSQMRLTVVWHGNTAQLHYEPERRLFAHLLELRENETIDAVGVVKPGMQQISPHLYPKTLVNLPPSNVVSRERTGMSHGALIPVPNDWRKNYFTNLFAAGQTRRIRDLYLTTRFDGVPAVPFQARVIYVPRPSRTEMFNLLDQVDVVLNASLSECQPMTALEALAKRVPCITGPLSLEGPLGMHPFQALCQVIGVDDVAAVAEALERVLSLAEQRPTELREMMADYEQLLRTEAISRFHEFIEP